MRTYLDACTVIYFIERHPVYFDRVAAQLDDPRTHAVVSELCRLECLVKPLRENNRELLQRYEVFFHANNLLAIPFGRAVFQLATELRAAHGLKTPDALHLAAAISSGCDQFCTNDRRLEKAAGDRIAIADLKQ
jgi:predicted nucleic acid-binding protein